MFPDTIAVPYIAHPKENTLRQFSSSHDVVSALSTFDPCKVPGADSISLPTYGNESIEVLLNHYCEEKPALKQSLERKRLGHRYKVSTEIRS